MGERVYARRPFDYGTLSVARGEVFDLAGARNDEKLVRLRYVDRVAKGARLYEHGPTGRKFIEAGFLEAFGTAYLQAQQDLTMAASGGGVAGPYGLLDTTGDAEERRLNQEAPLAVENSRASRR